MRAPDPASPGDRRPVSVFVSYAHEDRARAQQVLQALERAGFQVWWDGLIVAGAAYAIETEQALEAASAVVVLWSRYSIASHWVRDEAAVGRDRSRLVPVSLDRAEPRSAFGSTCSSTCRSGTARPTRPSSWPSCRRYGRSTAPRRLPRRCPRRRAGYGPRGAGC